MAEAARESDATMATGFNYRCVPTLQLAKRMLDADEFGDIRRFRGQYL
jgi:predicted dehydrogenase